MSLLLRLEQGPRSQAVRQTSLDRGELVIGRSPEADWQIDDPDMFVSRVHCRITANQDEYIVTDTSSSGLFIDDAESPLGTGNAMRLRDGMRLRLGDYVLCVGIETEDARKRPSRQPPAEPARPAARTPASFGDDDFFSMRTAEEPQRPRPKDLPDPFEKPVPGAYRSFDRDEAAPPRSPAFDDPFSLDPVATPAAGKPERRPAENGSRYTFFGTPVAETEPASAVPDEGFGFEQPAPAARRRPAVAAKAAPEPTPTPAPWDLPASSAAPARRPAAKARAAPAAQAGPVDDSAMRAAFLRGAGMDEADVSGRDAIAEMEKFGREYRMMMEGLMQLLRKRAEEKGNARIEQTLVGASEVNPLKFLPSVDDAMAMIFAENSPGFLAGEQAITDAVRDLAHHHIRAWAGVQGALRRMVDRFSPAAIEEELKASSALGTLLTGGRSAKLWELYCKRHREIAQSAETRFLGEIGADFRDAYEEE